MKKILPIVSLLALVCVILPACLYLVGSLDKPLMKTLMLAGTVVWFATVPLWMGKKEQE